MDRYEAHVLAMLHHPNITTFYGVSSFDEQLTRTLVDRQTADASIYRSASG